MHNERASLRNQSQQIEEDYDQTDNQSRVYYSKDSDPTKGSKPDMKVDSSHLRSQES